MKQATEYIRGLRYKLQMMGTTVDELAYIFGDNQSVLANTTAPGSTSKKKSNAIAYHFIWEGCAQDKWRMTYINTDENVADLLTKPLAGPKGTRFVRMLLHHYTWWIKKRITTDLDNPNLYLLTHILVSLYICSQYFPNGVYEFQWFSNVTQSGFGFIL